jgi:hypothetical protein
MGEAPSVGAGTPKLLELDKKDVDAVRTFLPEKSLAGRRRFSRSLCLSLDSLARSTSG